MRIGVIGAGRIGVSHAHTLARIDGVDEVLVADVEPKRAADLVASVGAPHVRAAAVGDLLERGAVEGLVIAASTAAHTELLLAAVATKTPAFCEKPVAADIAGTVNVRDAIEAAGILVQMGFQRRFDAGHVAVREAVASGELGRLHTVRSQTLDPAPPPAAYIRTSGGIFRDCCVHDFDAIRWLTGVEIAEVYATGANRAEPFFAEYGDVATAACLLTLADGTLAHVAATRHNAAGYDVRCEALGQTGSVAAGLGRATPLRLVGPDALAPDRTAYTGFGDRFADAYAAELAAFVARIASGGPSPCTVDDALLAFYVAEAAERSRSERRPVELAEVVK